MFIIIFLVVFNLMMWFLVYGGLPATAAIVVGIISAVIVIWRVCIAINELPNAQKQFEEEYKKKRPDKELMKVLGKEHRYAEALAIYEKAEKEREMARPLGERLLRRQHWRTGHDDNCRIGERCFICGGDKEYKDRVCTRCEAVYRKNCDFALPKGIEETDRFAFWMYQQAITADFMKGEIDEATARSEIASIPEEFARESRERQKNRELELEWKRRKEREPWERAEIAERLSR